MDLGDLAGQALAFQPSDDKVERIPELGKDEHFCVGIPFQYFPQLFELTFLLAVVHLASQPDQPPYLDQLGPQFLHGARRRRRLGLLILVLGLFLSF